MSSDVKWKEGESNKHENEQMSNDPVGCRNYHAHDVIMLADKMSVQTRVHNRLIFSDEYCKDEKLKTYTENTI